MPDDPLTLQVARHYNTLQLDRIPSEVIDAAKLHILDTIGCLFAGTRLEPGKLAYELAVATSGASAGSSTLFGTTE
jgi:2-methylcitrate dehydratase PrpD